MLIGADTTSWYIGLGLGAVVVVVAVIIVVTILVLANRIAGQAETAVGAVDVVKAQTDELSRRRHRSTTRGCGSCTRPGRCERRRWGTDGRCRSPWPTPSGRSGT